MIGRELAEICDPEHTRFITDVGSRFHVFDSEGLLEYYGDEEIYSIYAEEASPGEPLIRIIFA